MFSLNGSVFDGNNTLGIGSVGGFGAVPKGSASSCPAGMIEYGGSNGIPAMCGSSADYDAFIQQQVTNAFGSKEAAKSYLQTTQYGVEQNYGCSPPNIPSTDASGKPICLDPYSAKNAGMITTCPKGTEMDPKTGSCLKVFSCTPGFKWNLNLQKCEPTSSGGGSVTGGGSVSKPPAPGPGPVTPPEPPVSQSGISPMAIAAVVLGVGAIGAIIYKVRKDKKAKGGMRPNEHCEEGYLDEQPERYGFFWQEHPGNRRRWRPVVRNLRDPWHDSEWSRSGCKHDRRSAFQRGYYSWK